MHIELIEERARTERIITGFAVAMGAEIEPTDLTQMREDYDKFLRSDAKRTMTPEELDRLELMQALGIAR